MCGYHPLPHPYHGVTSTGHGIASTINQSARNVNIFPPILSVASPMCASSKKNVDTHPTDKQQQKMVFAMFTMGETVSHILMSDPPCYY